MTLSVPRSIKSQGYACVKTDDVILRPIALGDFNFDKDHGLAIYNPQTRMLFFSWNCTFEQSKEHVLNALPTDKSTYAQINFYGNDASPLIHFLLPCMLENKVINLDNVITHSVNENGYVRVPGNESQAINM